MPNEGPIKYSLQRQRPFGREKPPHPPHPTACYYHYRDSFYEQNILKVNNRGSLKNTHSASNECSIFDFLSFPFFFAISTPGLGVFSENLMEMEGKMEKSHRKYMNRIPMDLW